jgi:Ca2+-binding RTX toxin-like protein
MTNDINDPNANNLIGLWDFLDDGKTDDTGLADSTAQNGHLEGGAGISGGQMHTDGSHDYFDVETSDNSDAPFNLSEGTVAVQFTQSDHIGWSPDVVVNRGEYDDTDEEGWFGLSVTHDGKVTVDHADNGQSAHLSTEAGFFNEHDTINATYAWSETDGLTLNVQNLTQNTETTVTSSQTGLTMDVTDNDDESWTFGAREEDGAIDYVAVYDKDIVNNGPDGAVDGEETGEDMALGYDDANAPTDGGGDVITDDADLIFGNGGGDTINGAAGNDTIYGDSGFDSAGSGSMVRESFEWDKIDDTDGGSGAVDHGDPLDGGVTQNTGNVDVTFSVVNATSQVRTEFADNQQKVHSITDDGNGVDAHSSMASELDGDYANATYAFDFSKEVENVSFRVNDIDGDGLVKVYAYDAENNPVELDIDAGADLHASNQDGVDGTEVLDSEGGYEHDTSPNHSALINIAGPVARIDVQHIENGPANSGINITDMYYDAPVGAGDNGAAGDDSLLGDDGDDVLYGEGGDDTLEGGAGSDLMYGDSPDAAGTAATGSITITGQNGDYNGALLVEIRDGETGDVKDTLTLTDDYDGNIGESYDIPLEDGDTFRVGITSPDGTFYSDSENAVSTTTSPDGSVSLAFEDLANPGDEDSDEDDDDEDDDDEDSGEPDFNDVTVDVDFAETGATLLTDGGAVTASAPTEEGDGEGGNDTFIISDSADADGDVVIGGNGPDDTTDEDVLDLRGTGQVTIADAADANDDGARAGTVTFADGSTLEFSQIETILTDPQSDGIVDGANAGETMELGYTDPQGDQITTGDDSIRGNDGDDMIDGDAGNDRIDGGAGDDEVTGAAGTDSVDGGDGSDTLVGGDGTDTLNGDAGDDDIAVGGSDSATGGTGDDVFTIDTIDPAPDIDATIDGGSDGTDGNPDGPENGDEGDTLDLSDRSEDLTVVLEDADPESGTVDGLDADNNPDVTFDEIEKIVTGSGGDTVDGDGVSGPIDVVTGAGNDSVDGGDQGDTIDTGPGNDTVNSGDGADTVDGGEGDNLIDTSGDGIPLLDDKNGDGDGFAAYGPLPAAPADPDENDDRDVVTTGSGNDTILTGDDDDTITAAGGDNDIDAGIDDDDITTGDGSDTIVGGEGSDTVLSGGGDDRIFGGLNPDDVPVDELNIPDAPDGGSSGPDPDEENGRDLIDAGAGNDTVFGQDDDDTMFGGTGNDVLDGGVDDDTISGDAGQDTIIGGQGADTMSGGAGSDVFQIDSREDAFGDVIDGGTEDGDGDPNTDNENDQLDLRDLGRFEIVQSDGTTPLDLTSPNDPDGNSFSGEVNFIAADGTLDGTLEFNEIENVIPCFTPGTVIATPKGERLVEDLEVGDRVITRDNGLQEIRWVGRRNLSGQELLSAPHLKPVLIRAGSLGRGLPERDMMVSPQHRLLINNERSALYFEEREVLAAAKHLTGIEGVDSVEASGVSYIHFMFDQHEVVLSNGSWTESFQPGEQTLDGMGEAQKSELFGLFPELQESEGVQAYESARRSLKKHEARLLVK